MEADNSQIIQAIDLMIQQDDKYSDDALFLKALPKTFIDFLQKKSIPYEEMLIGIPRFIRVKPNLAFSPKQLAQKMKIIESQVIQIDEQFFALSPSLKINNTQLYQEAKIYGMDFSSAIPVRCLQVEQGHKVLELCSAPGNKSMYLADRIKDVSITAVQINQNRAQVMKNLIKKYDLSNKINVQIADGLTFRSQSLFDRILIDAECTHQGSIKHLKKFMKQSSKTQKKEQIKKKKNQTRQQEKQYEKNNSNPYTSVITTSNTWSEKDFDQRFLDPLKLSNLFKLQFGLLENGFKLVKQNGIIVYSTCSFDKQQNQNLVKKFVKMYLENSDQNQYYPSIIDCTENLSCALPYERCEYFEQTIRLSPKVSRTGGMFICKIKKVKKEPKSHSPSSK